MTTPNPAAAAAPVLPQHHARFATAAAVFFTTVARIHAEQSARRVRRNLDRARGHLAAARAGSGAV